MLCKCLVECRDEIFSFLPKSKICVVIIFYNVFASGYSIYYQVVCPKEYI